MKRIQYSVLFLSLLSEMGCGKKEPPPPEPVVHNAFTDYVDRGVTTMHKAQDAADKANTIIQQQNQQAAQIDPGQ